MPDFDAICKEYEGRVAFMMVNLTGIGGETQQSAQEFVDSMGYSFPIYFDTHGDAVSRYEIESIPITFFIDAKGGFVAYGQGALDEDTLRMGIGMILEEE